MLDQLKEQNPSGKEGEELLETNIFDKRKNLIVSLGLPISTLGSEKRIFLPKNFPEERIDAFMSEAEKIFSKVERKWYHSLSNQFIALQD